VAETSRASLPVSVAVISLNAASQIGACLESVGFADDIVVLDSGSTDGTCDNARGHGARGIRQAEAGGGGGGEERLGAVPRRR
jgi:glycosyltransferase involved in cell wall biosynthesis